MTEFATRGLICAIINIEESCFEILFTVYLKKAWCLVYALLYQSIGNSVGVFFNDLPAEFPSILDSFLSHEVVGKNEVVGKHEVAGKHTCILDPLVNVVK